MLLQETIEKFREWVVLQLEVALPGLDSVRRLIYQGQDPVKNGDMRGVWVNLRRHFMNSSDMGMLTTTSMYFRDAVETTTCS